MANQVAFKWLHEGKNVIESNLRSFKMAYSTLKDQTHGLALKLSSSEKSLQATYNQVVPLRQELLEAMASQASI